MHRKQVIAQQQLDKQTLSSINVIFDGNDRSPRNQSQHIETLMADHKTNREKALAKQVEVQKYQIYSP